MAIAINGAGTITGISAGGLPDGTVDADTLASGTRKLIQRVSTQTGALATGTTAGPYLDDTIPQNTEGDQVLSLAITPTSASSNLQISANIVCGMSAGTLMAALFQDSTANALASTMHYVAVANTVLNLTLCHTMTAGTTSSTTFKVRMGSQVSHTFSLNGVSGGRLHGGISISSMIIEEYV